MKKHYKIALCFILLLVIAALGCFEENIDNETPNKEPLVENIDNDADIETLVIDPNETPNKEPLAENIDNETTVDIEPLLKDFLDEQQKKYGYNHNKSGLMKYLKFKNIESYNFNHAVDDKVEVMLDGVWVECTVTDITPVVKVVPSKYIFLDSIPLERFDDVRSIKEAIDVALNYELHVEKSGNETPKNKTPNNQLLVKDFINEQHEKYKCLQLPEIDEICEELGNQMLSREPTSEVETKNLLDKISEIIDLLYKMKMKDFEKIGLGFVEKITKDQIKVQSDELKTIYSSLCSPTNSMSDLDKQKLKASNALEFKEKYVALICNAIIDVKKQVDDIIANNLKEIKAELMQYIFVSQADDAVEHTHVAAVKVVYSVIFVKLLIVFIMWEVSQKIGFAIGLIAGDYARNINSNIYY